MYIMCVYSNSCFSDHYLLFAVINNFDGATSSEPAQLLVPFFEQVRQMNSRDWYKAWNSDHSDNEKTPVVLLEPYFEVKILLWTELLSVIETIRGLSADLNH